MEAQELKEKLAAQEQQFQNYKTQCKQLQQFLEGESQKKEVQIRKLKEDSINKDKAMRALKTQISTLQTLNATLQTEKVSLSNLLSQNASQHSKEQENDSLKESIIIKDKQIFTLKEQINAKQLQIVHLKNMLQQQNQKAFLLNKNIEQIKSSKQKQSKNEKEQNKEDSLEREKEYNNKIKEDAKKYEMQIERLKSTNRKLQQKCKKLEDMLRQQEKHLQIEDKSEQEIGVQCKGIESWWCLMLTKPHYSSPYLIQDKNSIKILKAAKNGYDKSLGTTKHKFNAVLYSAAPILQQIAARVAAGGSHTIIFFGSKYTSKKHLFNSLLSLLSQYITSQLQNSKYAKGAYSQSSAEETKSIRKQIEGKEAIEQLLLQLQNTVSVPKTKENNKRKVRYLSIQFDNNTIEFITSNFTQQIIRGSQIDVLNQIVYSKLPNVLQNTVTTKHMILTLNPIVELYDQCKNTLNTTLAKHIEVALKEEYEMKSTLTSEQFLNQTTKRKIQNMERENDQWSIRSRKMEGEVQFYKNKFQELESRLKNLLNTHQTQNSYLKKSPVTLSYEKMLAFVHNVQNRSPNRNHSIIHIDDDFNSIEAL